jgi:L-galactose dehydrogenase/L-glyceraldehyde 3-phosphate reductase
VKFRTLGRTGLKVSEIGFGCGTTAGLMIAGKPEEQRDAVARALELGINYFDTAPVYGDAASEANLGRTLRALGAEPHIATKVALSAADFPDIGGAVIRSVEASMERLGRSKITLIQLHNRVASRRAAKAAFGTGALLSIDDVLGAGGVVEAFRNLRARGLVDFFGCSAFGGEPMAVDRLIDSGAFDTIIVSYSALNTSAWLAAPPGAGIRDYALAGSKAAAAGMGAVALRVLEGGILSGAHALPSARGPAPDDAEMMSRAAKMRALAESEGCSLPEVGTRFALSNPDVSTVLIGFSDRSQIEQAAGFAARGGLSASTLSRIESLFSTARVDRTARTEATPA